LDQSIGIDDTNTFQFLRVGVANLDQSIGIVETNTFQLNFLSSMKIVGVTGFCGFRSIDRYWWEGRGKLFFGSIDRYWWEQYISVKIFYVGVDVTNFFWVRLNFYYSIKTVGATVLGGLWALGWAWHIRVINLRCVTLEWAWHIRVTNLRCV